MSNIIEMVGSTPNFSWQKDHISELPDAVLLVILSRLTIKEAARTSVLSHRWETLWTFISSLNFDASETLDYLQKRLKCLHYERVQYPRWVNKALNSHIAPTIEEFRICFYLTNNSADDINRWISFAIKKGVQKLELNLSSIYLTDWYKMPWQPFGIASFNSLRALHLNNVDFDDEVLEHLICSSPFLEHLCIEESFSLKNFKIGPSIHLKYVEIYRCEHLRNIEISAIYLFSFKYIGQGKIRLHFENVPRLVEVSFAGMFLSVVDISRQLSSHLWQLQKLVLDMSTECSNSLWSCLTEFPKWPTLSNLRHLEVEANVGGDMISHPILSLLEASPFIHTFKLQLDWHYYSPILVPKRKARKVVTKKHPYQFLEVVELLGFVGDTGDTEIAFYLLEETVSLKRLIVSPYDLELSRIPSEFVDREKLLTRECAIQLGTKLPTGAKFQLLEN